MSIIYEILIEENTVKMTDELGTVFFIPCDPNNSDYAAYLATLG